MAHSLKRVLFWLSGAGTETLEQCPNWEQRKYVAFGATVLVPCAFALIIYPVATVWALIILTMTAPPSPDTAPTCPGFGNSPHSPQFRPIRGSNPPGLLQNS